MDDEQFKRVQRKHLALTVQLDVLRRFMQGMTAEKHRTCNCPERMLEAMDATDGVLVDLMKAVD